MTPQLDGVYVPLAIVERQQPKPQPRNQQEEKEKETEKLIPIAEERFFEDVLRQGKSDISQGRKIAIIGEPGAGKTTRLQKIADWILEQELGLPVWIDLAELGDRDICEYLEKVWLPRCPGEVTRRDLEAQINRVWLLLDGVDEMANTQGMQQLAKDLLRTWVQAARVVVTCRVNVWEADQNAFSGFDVFRNLEFNAQQVTEYIRRWFAGMGDAATGESLELALAESENSRLKELIQNPLRLWMLCQIWSSRQGTLPDTQAKLYASFIEYFYRWKEQIIKSYVKLCGKNKGECKRLLHEGLGELAKAAIDGKSSRFRLSYRLVSQYLGDRNDETSLLSLALSLGWLNRVGIDFDEPEESVYGFYHATFQEYFAALAVKDWDYFLPRNHVDFPVVGKEYRIFEAQWKQVILLWLGRGDVADEEKERFIEKLVNFDDGCGEWDSEKVDRGFYEYKAYFIAAAGVAEFTQFSQIHKMTDQIIKWGFGYFKLETQTWMISLCDIQEIARKVLIETSHELAINGLLELLFDNKTHRNSRILATSILGIIGTRNNQVINVLVEGLLRPYINNFNCSQAAQIIGKIGIGSEQAINALAQALTDPYTDKDTGWQVVVSLGKIGVGSEQAINALAQALTDRHIGKDTHWQAAVSLGKIGVGSEQAINALTQALTDPCIDQDTRWQAAVSLGKIGIGSEQAINCLLLLLGDSTLDLIFRECITETLGKIGHKSTKVVNYFLKSIIDFNVDWEIRRQSAENLGKIGAKNKKIATRLLQLLSQPNSDWDVQWLVVKSLEKIDDNNLELKAYVLKSILQILTNQNTDRYTYRMVLWSIGNLQLQDKIIINYLTKIINNVNLDKYIHKQAEQTLKKITQYKKQPRTIKNQNSFKNPPVSEKETSSNSLKVNLMTYKQMTDIVTTSKDRLSNKIYKYEFDQFEQFYKLIWHSAQDLPPRPNPEPPPTSANPTHRNQPRPNLPTFLHRHQQIHRHR